MSSDVHGSALAALVVAEAVAQPHGEPTVDGDALLGRRQPRRVALELVEDPRLARHGRRRDMRNDNDATRFAARDETKTNKRASNAIAM
jgi:hypothetical protein